MAVCSSRRQALLALAPLLVAPGLLTACDQQEGAEAAPAPQPLPVRVEVVDYRATRTISRYPAVIRPQIEAELGFRVAGKVVERLVGVGEKVDVGAPLARLDPTDLEHEARVIEARLASARAALANASAEFRRFERLHDRGWSSQQDFEDRRATLDAANARIDELEAELLVARNNVAYTMLVADVPGVVTDVLIEPGQVVQASQTVVRLAELDGIDAVADIPEPQVARLREADLEVELWAMPGVALKGRLRELSPMADPLTRTFEARIELLDPPPGVELGMTASLAVDSSGGQTAARLPLAALLHADREPAVWVLDESGSRVDLRPVRVARYTADSVLVEGGLAAGEKVVTAGVHKLSASQRVRIWTEPDR